MDALIAAKTIRMSLGIVLVLLIFYLGIRSYLVDRLRQTLFAIRDDLFDFAADGGIDFRDPCYCRLRDDLNGLIRFAHKISASRVLMSSWVMTLEIAVRQQSDWEVWLDDVGRLGPLARRKLLSARHEALASVVLFVFERSLLLLPVYLTIRIAGLWLDTARRLNQRLPKYAERLEAQALSELDCAA